MFRLVAVSVLACVASVQCGTILAPAKLVSEEVVESHGNSIVHASAPLVAAAVAPTLRYTNVALVQRPVAEIVQPGLTRASLIAEGTIEAHGHQVVHGTPLGNVESYAAIPAIATRASAYAAPIYYPSYYPHLIAEKTVSSYGHSVRHGA